MWESKQAEKQRCHMRMHFSIWNGLFLIYKETKKRLNSNIEANSNQLCHSDACDNSKYSTLLCTVILLRAKILADKCRKCHRHTGNWEKCKSLKLTICTNTGHCKWSKWIDIFLNNDISNTDNRILNTCRKTLCYYLMHHRTIIVKLFKIKTCNSLHFTHTINAHYCTYTLRNDCCRCCTAYTPVEHSNK